MEGMFVCQLNISLRPHNDPIPGQSLRAHSSISSYHKPSAIHWWWVGRVLKLSFSFSQSDQNVLFSLAPGLFHKSLILALI